MDYDDSTYPECEHNPPCTGDRENAPCRESDQIDLAFRQLMSRNWDISEEAHAYNVAVSAAAGDLVGKVTNYLKKEASK